jgi:predicted ribosomally synthesized peptide with SipW-like signal peptide
MKKRKSSPIILAIAIVLAVATLVSGATFAWFTSRSSTRNHLETDQMSAGDVTIYEVWDPEDGEHWQPGEQLNKHVGAVNTGDVPAMVRISFDEVLYLLQDAKTQPQGLPETVGADGQPDVTVATQTYSAHTSAVQVTKVPHLFNAGAYSAWGTLANGTGNTGLGTVTIDGTALSAGEDAKVTVKYNVTTVGDQTIVNVAAYAPLTGISSIATPADPTPAFDPVRFNGLNQGLQYEVEVIKPVAPATVPDVVVTLNGFEEYTYDTTGPDGTTAKKDWTAAPLRSIADFAATGNPEFNTDIVTPAAHKDTFAVTDATKKYLQLIFDNNVIFANAAGIAALTVADQNKWIYSADDGWFYYFGQLAPGSTTANNLLNSLYLRRDTPSSYSNLSFDLIVKMEASQALPQAFDGLFGTAATTTAIKNQMISLGIMPNAVSDPAMVP